MNKVPPFRIEWDAPEHEHKERTSDWFWAVGIVSVAIAVASIIFGNTIFAILVLVSAFSMALFINKPPQVIHVTMTEAGIARGKVFYPFSTLSSYWLDSDHPHPKIILCSEKLLMPLIVVPIGSEDPYKLDETLSKFLPEKYHALPIVEKLLEYLGF